MKQTLILFFILTISTWSNAQDYGMGLILDVSNYNNMPLMAERLTRDYTVLPSSYSLEQYCPETGNQKQYGTCSAWSSAYAARTMAEAIANEWTDKTKITAEAFSPWFLYTNVKWSNDYNCSKGATLNSVFDCLKNKGVPKLKDYNSPCETSISSSVYSLAYAHRLENYQILYSYEPGYNLTKITKVKKAISEKHPVVIGMEIGGSFNGTVGDCWDGNFYGKTGQHAMCVVGYDDNKYGGAFKILNSWGAGWRSNGYVWVKYDDFAKYVWGAVEMYVPQKQSNNIHLLSGSLKLQLSTGEEMRGSLSNGIYKISGEYISGTRYRIYISNNQPAYVYVIGSDLQNNVSKVFPPNDHISPALTYKSNNIAIPDEKWFVQMDNTVGKDYICVLYSAEELDINAVVNKIRNGYGSFYDKVSSALSGKLATSGDVNFSQNTISFSAQTNKTVVAVIAEVVHK
ncbi:MAG: DUF4384 domain-containing protein [Bacteroidales bacterium]|nr:DUF4384 domain-containing protein [Bacteroidales bacterium]